MNILFLLVPWFFIVSAVSFLLAIVSQCLWAGGEHPRNSVFLKNGSAGQVGHGAGQGSGVKQLKGLT